MHDPQCLQIPNLDQLSSPSSDSVVKLGSVVKAQWIPSRCGPHQKPSSHLTILMCQASPFVIPFLDTLVTVEGGCQHSNSCELEFRQHTRRLRERWPLRSSTIGSPRPKKRAPHTNQSGLGLSGCLEMREGDAATARTTDEIVLAARCVRFPSGSFSMQNRPNEGSTDASSILPSSNSHRMSFRSFQPTGPFR